MNSLRRVKRPPKVIPGKEDHGRHIFVYNEVMTKRVVYSLTREMNNTRALRQLTFVGKKSVPAALRKDMWTPMATITFPTPDQGLNAYRELREWRKLHETQWDPKLRENKTKKQFIKTLMDQKANSVADIAATLTRQWDRGLEGSTSSANETTGQDPEAKSTTLPAVTDDKVVRIQWADVYDAEWAQRWPPTVIHDQMEQSRYAAPDPARAEATVEV